MRPIDADALKISIDDGWKPDMMVSEIWSVINEAPTVGEWISVKDRLPENGQWVLCKCRAEIYEVLRNDFGSWYHDINHTYMSGFVTHWMPLPEPPKEEKEDA